MYFQGEFEAVIAKLKELILAGEDRELENFDGKPGYFTGNDFWVGCKGGYGLLMETYGRTTGRPPIGEIWQVYHLENEIPKWIASSRRKEGVTFNKWVDEVINERLQK